MIESLVSLDNSWSRNEILNKLKNGEKPEEIINIFLKDNRSDIEKLSSCLQSKDKELLKHLQ